MIKQSADTAYLNLLDRILYEGKSRGDRTGTGTWSIFSHTLEIDMTKGFPLLTTKKMFTKGIVHELLWFLNGDTNIKYLVDNGVNIWTSDAYREYKNYAGKLEEPDYDVHVDDPNQHCTRLMTIEEFTDRIKTDDVFAKRFGELGPVYGKQWRNWKVFKYESGTGHLYSDADVNGIKQRIDQIQNLIHDLKTNPDSRRLMVSAWNVGEIGDMALPPCHWAFEVYVEDIDLEHEWAWIKEHAMDRYNQIFTDGGSDIKLTNAEMDKHFPDRPRKMLSLKWHQRSVDTFLGLPFNIASYGLLLHMFAQQTGMYPNKLIGDLSNVHIYKNHIDQCKIQLGRKEMESPRLILNKAKDIFSYCYDDVKIVGYESHPSIKGEISV